MDRDMLVLILVVFIPAALLWATFIYRSGGGGKARRFTLGIPRAQRPGLPDDVLEGRRLEKILWGGVASSLVLAAFIPVYWLPESTRQDAFVERFDEESLERGKAVYAIPLTLPEGISAVEFKADEESIALAMGCANCHGGTGEGGLVPGGWTDPVTGRVVKYQAPPLDDVLTRWDEEVVKFTIKRGRPGTPMPTWGQEFGGPMTEQMVDDVFFYLSSLEGNQAAPAGISKECEKPGQLQQLTCGKQIFEVRCAVCHGPLGQGKEEVGLTLEEISAQIKALTGDDVPPEKVSLGTLASDYPEVDKQLGLWYQGMTLWKGDITHLSPEMHVTTITNGRRFGFMPSFGETPAQGIPVPLYPLTDKQIEAVMAYERSL